MFAKITQIVAIALICWGSVASADEFDNEDFDGPTDDFDTSVQTHDPWERTNRKIFNFNESLDDNFMEPLASSIDNYIPDPINIGVSNFFSNLREVRNIVNNTLQGKPKAAVSDTGRLVVNSTLGIAGLFDVASRMNLEKHEEDFGQTLAVWGVESGPYMVLPFLGPSTARDATGLIGDFITDPVSWVTDWKAYTAILAVRLVDQRIDLLTTIELLEQAALDRYTFQRDAWLQNRIYLINDGELISDDDDF